MSERILKITMAVVLGGVYAGLLGYSVMGADQPTTDTDQRTERRRTIPPRVMYHDNDVDVYSRRSVRSSGQRGGGLRGGK